MADAPESVTVETVRAHSNSFGNKFKKAKGDKYDVPDKVTRESLINAGLVEAVKAAG